MTRTELGAEEQALVEQVRTLSRERFAPRAARYDAESVFPSENYADLRAAGLLGLSIPVAYGGRGAGSLTYALCLLEMAKGCSATALTFNMHATVLTFIAALATEEQKRRYFAEVVREGKLMASITSEPESSFRDKFVLQTVFRPVTGGYQVSGVKQFCSLGESADYYFVSGMREGSATAQEGLLSALIQRTAPGVKVEGTWNAMGMRGTVSHTIRYETFGELNADKSNAILVCHALSASAHAAGKFTASDEEKPGWWDGLIGYGKGIDLDKYFVICANLPGSPFGDRKNESRNRFIRSLVLSCTKESAANSGFTVSRTSRGEMYSES